jgi:hypothetical protein
MATGNDVAAEARLAGTDHCIGTSGIGEFCLFLPIFACRGVHLKFHTAMQIPAHVATICADLISLQRPDCVADDAVRRELVSC